MLKRGRTISRIDYNLFIWILQGIGEPPLCLAVTVFYAIKQAIYSARSDYNSDQGKQRTEGHFRLDSPATAERIRVACKDRFTDMVCDLLEWTASNCLAGIFKIFTCTLFYI